MSAISIESATFNRAVEAAVKQALKPTKRKVFLGLLSTFVSTNVLVTYGAGFAVTTALPGTDQRFSFGESIGEIGYSARSLPYESPSIANPLVDAQNTLVLYDPLEASAFIKIEPSNTLFKLEFKATTRVGTIRTAFDLTPNP